MTNAKGRDIMVVMSFRDGKVNVNILEELEKYEWDNAKWTESRLICSSPFRDDNAPSFFIDLHTGGWGDSGAYTDDTVSGNFLDLLMKLNNFEKFEAIEYLFDNHSVVHHNKRSSDDTRLEGLTLPPENDIMYIQPKDDIVIEVSPRMSQRGISEEVQKLFNIGYSPEHKGYTAIPWMNRMGDIANIKYRSVQGKKFFFSKGAEPIHRLLYGAHLHEAIRDIGSVVVVEGEVDAMSFWTAGIPAVAVGTSKINEWQLRILQSLDVHEVVLGGDNDFQGQLLNKQVASGVVGSAVISEIDYGVHKDGNDVMTSEGVGGIIKMYNKRKPYEVIKGLTK